MKRLLALALLALALPAAAQDDLMNQLADEPLDSRVRDIFKSTRIVNSHSVEMTKARHLDLRVSHKFGLLNSGYDQFFGLDNAVMRLGLDYGLTNDITVGIGRSSLEKVVDGFAKWRIMHQQKNRPVSIVAMTSAYVNTTKKQAGQDWLENKHRWSYFSQLMIGRKFGNAFSLQLAPGYLHRNLVQTTGEENGLVTMGAAARLRLTRSVHLTADYVQRFDNNDFQNPLGLGIDLETGGHVFQLFVSNTMGLAEPQFIGYTAGKFFEGDLHFGFHIVRTFSFARTNAKW